MSDALTPSRVMTVEDLVEIARLLTERFPTAPIPMLMEGRPDADCALEPDEMDF